MPNTLPVRITSNCVGRSKNCHRNIVDVKMIDSQTPGYSRASAVTVSRQSVELASTLACPRVVKCSCAEADGQTHNAPRAQLDFRNGIFRQIAGFSFVILCSPK